MNTFIIALLSGVLYLVAYYTYGRYLARRLFRIKPEDHCPSHTQSDGKDYVPTSRWVLFGHHFTSIAGTGPIVGPAIAIIWGWLPALLWILIGSIFMGAVHDFGSLMISLRHQGRSIGDIAGDLISPRVRILFLLIICFSLWIVIAIFGVVIASVFNLFPTAVLPVWLQIPIALWLGHAVYRKGTSALLAGLVAVIAMYVSVWFGTLIPLEMPDFGGLNPVGCWVVVLLIYAYIASTLPVQTLLQPRDYINAFQLIVALLLLLTSITIAQPTMSAPLYQAAPTGAPPLIPLLFITLACGAISGFHSLVASGTTSKQCRSEADAQSLSYGSMLLEGFLAILVLIACGAGLGMGIDAEGTSLTGSAAFHHHYASWQHAQGLGSKIAAFVTGSSNLLASIGIPEAYSTALMGLFVAAFAATTLDTATRLQRYMIAEIARDSRLPALSKTHPATGIAVGSALLLAFSSGGGKGALALWPLFGAMNQLLGGLALLVITVWLASQGKRLRYTVWPMGFMLVMTAWAMQLNLTHFFITTNWLLFSIGLLIVLLQLWMLIETLLLLRRLKKQTGIDEQAFTK